jgi:anti-sigma factor RsiW
MQWHGGRIGTHAGWWTYENEENTVTCQEVAEFLMDYLNGELAQTQREVFEEHLGICPDCVAYLRSYELTIKAAKSACVPVQGPDSKEVPEDLIRAILAAREIP